MFSSVPSKLKKLIDDIKRKWLQLSQRYNSLKFINGVFKRIIDDQVTNLSARITYYLLLALFPFMIFLLNLLMFFDIDSVFLMDSIGKVIPEESNRMVFDVANEVISNSGITLLSIGMITTLWSASKGSNSIIEGLNKAYDVKEDRSFFKVKGIGILATLGVPLIMVASFLFLVIGKQISQFLFGILGIKDYFGLWEMLRVLIPLATMTLYFTLFYKLAPNRKIKLKHALVGGLFSTLGWLSISLLFSFYVKNFGNYANIYGGIGSIIVLLLWLNLSTTILIIGGEINAEISVPCEERHCPIAS